MFSGNNVAAAPAAPASGADDLVVIFCFSAGASIAFFISFGVNGFGAFIDPLLYLTSAFILSLVLKSFFIVWVTATGASIAPTIAGVNAFLIDGGIAGDSAPAIALGADTAVLTGFSSGSAAEITFDRSNSKTSLFCIFDQIKIIIII